MSKHLSYALPCPLFYSILYRRRKTNKFDLSSIKNHNTRISNLDIGNFEEVLINP